MIEGRIPLEDRTFVVFSISGFTLCQNFYDIVFDDVTHDYTSRSLSLPLYRLYITLF